MVEPVERYGSRDNGERSAEIELLRSEHDSLEKRLADLERHISLTPTEQVERARIKKWKLRLKDRITALAGQHPTGAAPPPDRRS